MNRGSKATLAFYFNPFHLAPGTRVLIGYQTGAYVVLDPTPVPGRAEGDVSITYVKISDGRYVDALSFPRGAFATADVVFACLATGDMELLKATDRPTPCQGHGAITVVPGTLWQLYQAGELPTVDMDFHLDFVAMRTIARAVLSEDPTMTAVCRVLGISRHCLRRRLRKYGMPELSKWREELSSLRPELSEFARGGNQGNWEERSGGISELLAAVETGAQPGITPIEPVASSTLVGPDECTVLPFQGGTL